jgi:DNA repair photolyase
MGAPPAPSVGIQALIGSDLLERGGVQYTELAARHILNRCNTDRIPDCWTINPYRGCSFGCRYCYARYTHEFLGQSDPLAFERQVFVKVGSPELLASEATERKLRARPIAIGTATDPYQPAEARYELTRGILEVLARYRGLDIGIVTKSALITRDIELLGRIHARSRLHIGISLITPYRTLARRLDPGAPTPERRLRTVQSLAAAGLDVGVLASPILPSINDATRDLELLFRRSKAYEARWISVGPLFLASGSRRHFLAWLADAMPRKLPIYRHLFASGIDVDPRWERGLRRRVAVLRRRTGLPEGSARSREPASLQLVLPGSGERLESRSPRGKALSACR